MSQATLDLTRIGWPMCLTLSVVFGALGTYGAYINYISKGSDHSIEFYLGARNSQPMLVVAWGLFGTVVGAGLTSTAILPRQYVGVGQNVF
ncbi:hypothetical protein BASA60_000212 [Batrachochytrium salamandrivorans]|nr:hypothetical protein BASA60_000212 [Batrachochytrium salamandrivorans]